tara:strand:+ start:721 stop:1461 length:741 start_codon:yes stop_codon:yes gene_type:complete
MVTVCPDIEYKNIAICLDTFHKHIIPPRRATWIRTHFCYVCNTVGTEDTRHHYLKNAQRNNLIAYIVCDKCESLVPSLLKLYEETGAYVPDSIYKGIQLNNLAFLRKSRSTPTLPIYIEKGGYINLSTSVPLNEANTIIDSHFARDDSQTRVETNISWLDEMGQELTKTIYLSNLIFHNRRIFGHFIHEGPLAASAQYWHKYIIREYNQANQYSDLSNYIQQKTYGAHIDGLIMSIVYLFWRGELL